MMPAATSVPWKIHKIPDHVVIACPHMYSLIWCITCLLKCVWPQLTSNPLQSSWHPSTSASYVIFLCPFTLKFLNSRVQIYKKKHEEYQACRISFHSSSTEPPYDMVVAWKECRPYRGQGGETKTLSTPRNSHYHVSMNCIHSAEPRFMSHQLVIPNEVRDCLEDIHKGFILDWHCSCRIGNAAIELYCN